MDAIASHVHALYAELFPGAEVTSLSLLGQPAESHEASDKACGYGTPFCIDLRMPDGEARRVVLHTANPNEFGHDRRADLAAAALLAFDTMGTIRGTCRSSTPARSRRAAGSFRSGTQVSSTCSPATPTPRSTRRISSTPRAENAWWLADLARELKMSPVTLYG